ncbi:MAG: hypothetical protein ACI8WB_005851, partial [Phenylobacterium sp.]
DNTEQQRLQIAFSTDNLLQTHILADKDTHNGVTRLIFQDAVIGLLRLCEASLYQELTDSKLKSRLAGLWRVQAQLNSDTLFFSEENLDFTELVDDTFEQLSMLLDVLKRNVVRMKSLSQDFEDMSTDACKDPASFARFREQLLTQVSTLFERHIQPTQSFLNHRIRLKEGDNLFETLNSIKLAFEKQGKNAMADQVFRFSISFSGIFKPITDIAHQVDQFLRKTRASMAQFNAMEHHFQQLRTAYKQTLERNLNKTRIDSAFAQQFDFINGLKRFFRPKDFRISDSASYFENLFTEIDIRLADLALNTALPLTDSEAWQSDENSHRLKRAMRLYDYLANIEHRSTQDLTAALHYRLKDMFDDYQIVDLLSAVTKMRQKKGDYQLTTTNRMAYLSYGDITYIYRRKRLVVNDQTDAKEHQDG